MKIVNQEGFDSWKAKNLDPMGAACFSVAVRWADLMESEFPANEGKGFSELAFRTFRAANVELITGAMYGCVVSILTQHWMHGEALRRWHNSQYNEKFNDVPGAVVDPAMVTLG